MFFVPAACLGLMMVMAPVRASAALPGAEALAEMIVTEFDTNSDGIVDSGEWPTGTGKGFDVIDANRDGSVSEAELDGLAESISESTGGLVAGLVTVLIKKIVMTLDTNGDKLVTKAEYTAGCEAIFKRLDGEADGQLTKAELLELPLKAFAPAVK